VEINYKDRFPLWIEPWVSGIYALDDEERGARATDMGDAVPAVLTAYNDELGDWTLMMHVLDYVEMTGGEIEWSHWTAVRWRGGNSVSLYGRTGEGWHVDHVMDLSIGSESIRDLLSVQEMVKESVSETGSRLVARALLRYLPLANRLSIWDGKSSLFCCECGIDELREEPIIKDFLGREVIPLESWSLERDDDGRWRDFKFPLGKVSFGPDYYFTTKLFPGIEPFDIKNKTAKESKKSKKSKKSAKPKK
jgi:hypothetical protein